MNKEQFVDLMYGCGIAGQKSVESCLLEPAGKRPLEGDVKRSKWYVALPESDKAMVRDIIRVAIQDATMGILCELDGVGEVADTPQKGMLKLTYIKGEQETLITDPDQEYLHEIYRSLIEW